MTTNKVQKRTFEALRQRFPSWDDVLNEPVEQLIKVLEPAGLSHQKGTRIYQILETVKNDFGEVSLDHLFDLDPKEAEEYLTELPGVGKKTARCVMIYSLGQDAFPVDAHVLRVSKRLGWIPEETSWAKAHDVLQALIPPGLGHDLHVNMVVHGRETCHAVTEPECERCCIKKFCHYYQNSYMGTDIK